MELTYTKCGDYLIPDLVLSDTKEYHIGKYGRLRRAYLKEHRPILYTDLIVTEKLFPHLEEIDTACRERLEIIEKSMMQQEGVTEALKAADQMAWVRSMNSIHNRAEEIALAELVYTLVVFITGHPVEGWTTTMFVITVGFSGLFAVLTIVVKYLSLLVDLVFKQQKYLVESIEKLQK